MTATSSLLPSKKGPLISDIAHPIAPTVTSSHIAIRNSMSMKDMIMNCTTLNIDVLILMIVAYLPPLGIFRTNGSGYSFHHTFTHINNSYPSNDTFEVLLLLILYRMYSMELV
jgi:hypothetical protein